MPCHVGDMQHSVQATQIDECAKLGDILDNPLANLSRFDLPKQIGLEHQTPLLDQFSPTNDDGLGFSINLDDLTLDVSVDISPDISWSADINLAGRQEDIDADVHEQATLDLACDQARHCIALLVFGENASQSV